MPDDEEARPPTENTGMSNWRHNEGVLGHSTSSLGQSDVFDTRIGHTSDRQYAHASHATEPSNYPEDPWGQNYKSLEQIENSVDNQWNNNMYSTAYGYKTGVKGLKWGRRGV